MKLIRLWSLQLRSVCCAHQSLSFSCDRTWRGYTKNRDATTNATSQVSWQLVDVGYICLVLRIPKGPFTLGVCVDAKIWIQCGLMVLFTLSVSVCVCDTIRNWVQHPYVGNTNTQCERALTYVALGTWFANMAESCLCWIMVRWWITCYVSQMSIFYCGHWCLTINKHRVIIPWQMVFCYEIHRISWNLAGFTCSFFSLVPDRLCS